jgi:hypothetical protein
MVTSMKRTQIFMLSAVLMVGVLALWPTGERVAAASPRQQT